MMSQIACSHSSLAAIDLSRTGSSTQVSTLRDSTNILIGPQTPFKTPCKLRHPDALSLETRQSYDSGQRFCRPLVTRSLVRIRPVALVVRCQCACLGVPEVPSSTRSLRLPALPRGSDHQAVPPSGRPVLALRVFLRTSGNPHRRCKRPATGAASLRINLQMI